MQFKKIELHYNPADDASLLAGPVAMRELVYSEVYDQGKALARKLAEFRDRRRATQPGPLQLAQLCAVRISSYPRPLNSSRSRP